MLAYENTEKKKSREIHTRVYLEDNTDIVFYQYVFHREDVHDMNCVRIPIQEFAGIAKKALASYIVSKYKEYIYKK